MNVPGWTGTEPLETPQDQGAILDAIRLWGQPAKTYSGIKFAKRTGPKLRSGYTKNHGQGQSKARRLMAKASRRRNRVR